MHLCELYIMEQLWERGFFFPVLTIVLFPKMVYYTFSVADPTDHGLE